MKADLILIPKQIRAWLDVGMGLLVFMALVCLPVWIMICDGVNSDLLILVSVGSAVILLFILYVKKGLRKGYITREMFFGPLDKIVDMVKDILKKKTTWVNGKEYDAKFVEAALLKIGELRRAMLNEKWVILLFVLIFGLGLGRSVARAGLNEYEVKEIKHARELIVKIRTCATPVLHLGVYKGYVFNDGEGIYFMVGINNVFVDEFEEVE